MKIHISNTTNNLLVNSSDCKYITMERLSTVINFTLTCTVSQKTAKLFLSQFCQISTNCEHFWHNDGKEDQLTRGALIFHLT